MPDVLLDEVLAYGAQANATTEQMAAAVRSWHADTVTEARAAVSDQEKWWKGTAAVDRDVSSALEGLKTKAQLEIAQQAFPNPVQFQQFNDVLASSGYDPDKMDAPQEWIDTAKRMDAIATSPAFNTPRHQYGKIGFGPNKLADYSLREKEDGTGYEAVVFPTGDSGERRGDPLRVDLPPRAVLADAATKKAQLIGQNYDEVANGLRYGDTTMSPDFERQMEDAMTERDIMNQGPESAALHIALSQALKGNQQFISTIPQNNVQQFTTRPLLSLMRSLAQAGSAATGTGADILGEEGQNAVDLTTPGRLRARYETAGPTVGDAISQGIESLAAFAIPGGVVKAGGAALRASSAAGEGMAVLQSARGANFAGSAAYGTMAATSYGSNYSQAMQEAETAQQSGDAVKAERIRRYAQLTSLVKAGIEMATERIFPDEANLVSGKRITAREIATMPLKEGVEEGVGAVAQNQVNLISGQQDQNPLEAAWQGALGSIAFMGGMTLKKILQKQPQTRSAAGPAPAVRPTMTTNPPTGPGSIPGTAPAPTPAAPANTAFSAGTGTDVLPTGPGTVDGSLLAPPGVETAPAPAEETGPDATLFPTPENATLDAAPLEELTPATETDPLGTIPETPATLDEQFRRVKSGTKPGMIFPGQTAKEVNAAYQPGQEDDFVLTDTPAGAVLHPVDIPRTEVRAAVAEDRLGHLLGYGIPRKPVPTQDSAPPIAVTLRTAEGTEVDSVLTTPELAPAVTEKLQARAEPGDTVQMETPQDVARQRVINDYPLTTNSVDDQKQAEVTIKTGQSIPLSISQEELKTAEKDKDFKNSKFNEQNNKAPSDDPKARNGQTIPQGQEVSQAPEAGSEKRIKKQSAAPAATDDSMPFSQFRRPRTHAPNATAAAAASLQKSMPELAGGESVEFSPSVDAHLATPDGAARGYTPEQVAGMRTSEGFHDPATGRTVIFLDQLEARPGESARAAVARVLFHERIGHQGVNYLLKTDATFAAKWNALASQIPAADLAELRAQGYGNLTSGEVALEWLARQVDATARTQGGFKVDGLRGLARQLWDALRAVVNKILAQFGSTTAQRDLQLRELISRARRADVVRMGTGPIQFSKLPTPESNPTPSTVSPTPDYDTNRFGLRVQADERLRAAWRATFPPATYKTFTEEALRAQVREWMADNGGLEGATALFMDASSGLQDYERNALGQQLALSLDLRARRQENAKNAAGVAQTEAILDQVIATLETLATQAGQALRAFGMWSRFSPRGIVRAVQRETARKRDEHLASTLSTDPAALVDAVNKLDPTTATDEENEILNLWRVMQENADKPQGLAIAEVLKTLMPQRTDYRKRIDAQTVQAGFRQQMTDAGGQNLARNFWRIMAGPKPGQSSLSLFDGATQQALGSLLTRAMQNANLDSQHTKNNQATDVDKLVASLSTDPLRWDKIQVANEAVEKAIDELEDSISVIRIVEGKEVSVEISREQLRAAWEESTRDMAQHMASPGLLRRILRKDISNHPIEWKKLFDTGKPMQQVIASARSAAVNRIMATVQGRMSEGFNLIALQGELNTAFTEIATERYAGWLVQREAAAAQARRNDARRRMMAALRPQMQTQEATDKLDALFATYVVGGTPTKPGPRSELTTLLQNHLREAVPDFVAQMQALGVPANVAQEYDAAVQWHRQQAAERANRRLQDQLIKSLAPKTRAARDATPRFIRTLLEARRNGALSRADFLDAYSQAFKLPRFTPEFSARIRELAARVESTPSGSWLRNRAQSDLMTAIANWEGLKASDIWTAFWYANILSGLGTQLVNVSGNASHLLLKTSTVMLSNNPRHMMQFFKGLVSGATAGAKQAKEAFINGEPVMRGDEQWQKRDVLEMLWSDKPTTWGKLLGKYGVASWGRYVFRALTAMDAMFYNTAKEARAFLEISRNLQPGQTMQTALGMDAATLTAAQAQAVADLKSAGVAATPNNIDRRTLEILESKRAPDIQATARKFGGATTFNYEPQGAMGVFAGMANYLVNAMPPFRAVIPFSRIVANVADQALDWTGYGLVRAAMGKHASDVVRSAVGRPNAKAELFTARERVEKAIAGALGIVGMSAVYALALSNKDDDDDTVSFMIYGSGPSSPDRRAQMPKGWKPFSVKIGDYYISYAESPLNFMLGMVGASMDRQRYGSKKDREQGNRLLLLLNGAGTAFARAGVVSGLNSLFGMFDGQNRPLLENLAKVGLRTASGFTPAQGFMRDIAKAMDPEAVDITTIEGIFLQNLPALRTLSGKRLNVFGEPVKEPGPWLISRLVTKPDRSDADAVWLTRNKLHIPDLDAEIVVGKYLTKDDLTRLQNGYAPTEAQRQALIAQRDAGYLTPQQRETLLRTTGPKLREAIKFLQNVQAATPTVSTKQLQTQLNAKVEAARQQAMRAVIGL